MAMRDLLGAVSESYADVKAALVSEYEARLSALEARYQADLQFEEAQHGAVMAALSQAFGLREAQTVQMDASMNHAVGE